MIKKVARRVLSSLIVSILCSYLAVLLFLIPGIKAEVPPQISKKLSDEFFSRSKATKLPPEPEFDEIRPSGSDILVTVTVTSLITGEPSLPDGFRLSQNYPNPFNSTTIIEYDLPFSTDVTIVIYNTLGQKVWTLVGENKAAGYYRVEWDGNTSSGRTAATGIYLYRMQAGDFVKTKKMILVK